MHFAVSRPLPHLQPLRHLVRRVHEDAMHTSEIRVRETGMHRDTDTDTETDTETETLNDPPS